MPTSIHGVVLVLLVVMMVTATYLALSRSLRAHAARDDSVSKRIAGVTGVSRSDDGPLRVERAG